METDKLESKNISRFLAEEWIVWMGGKVMGDFGSLLWKSNKKKFSLEG